MGVNYMGVRSRKKKYKAGLGWQEFIPQDLGFNVLSWAPRSGVNSLFGCLLESRAQSIVADIEEVE